jgi:hypothetical protein
MMTKASSRLQIDDRAAATINAYPPEDQRRIRSAIGHLLGWDVLERLGERVRRLPTEEPLYIFRVPHGLRIVFSRECDMITVLDILRQGTLEAFAASAAAKAPIVEPGVESHRESSAPTKPKRTAPRTKAPKGPRRGARKLGRGE